MRSDLAGLCSAEARFLSVSIGHLVVNDPLRILHSLHTQGVCGENVVAPFQQEFFISILLRPLHKPF